MEGEGGDFLEIFSGGAAGGLDGQAVHHGGEIAGEVGGVGSCGEIIFFFGALEAIAEGCHKRFAVADEFLTHGAGEVGEGGSFIAPGPEDL